MTPQTPNELAFRLRTLALEMDEVGGALEYMAGFNQAWLSHGRQMIGAARIAREWADELESQAKTAGGE